MPDSFDGGVKVAGQIPADACKLLERAGVDPAPEVCRLPVVRLLDADLHAITERQCVEFVLDSLDRGCGGTIGTMNLDHLRRYMGDSRSAALYRRATILTADGMPLIWAGALQGTPLPERVTGSNLIFSLTAAAAARGRSVFFLGGEPGAAERTAAVLSRISPRLRVAGVSGRPDPGPDAQSQWNGIARMLAEARPDIVYVALGSPKQEELIEALRGTLPGAWWIGVGIAFSFVAGMMARAPLWMQRSGLEWFHRLLHEPKRLSKRYLLHGLPFAAALFAGAAVRGLAAKPGVRQP